MFHLDFKIRLNIAIVTGLLFVLYYRTINIARSLGLTEGGKGRTEEDYRGFKGDRI